MLLFKRLLTGVTITFIAIIALTLAALALFQTVMAVKNARGAADILVSFNVLMPLAFIAASILVTAIWRRKRAALWASLALTVVAAPVPAVGLYIVTTDPAPPISGFATPDDLEKRRTMPLLALFKPTREEWEASNRRSITIWFSGLSAIFAQFAATLFLGWRGVLISSRRANSEFAP